MTEEKVVEDAEKFLRATVDGLVMPFPRECLACYVARMLDAWGCAGTRFVTYYRDAVAPQVTGLHERLSRIGACCCDCELFLNAYELVHDFDLDFDADFHEASEEDEEEDEEGELRGASIPPCTGVRRGSTKPCTLWRGQRRG